MEIYSQLLGTGDAGEVLTALVNIQLSSNRREAIFQVTNTSPKASSNQNFNIRQIFFNTRTTSIRVKSLFQSNLPDSNFVTRRRQNSDQDFQYVLEDDSGKGLSPSAKLTCVLELGDEEDWDEQSWLQAPFTSINKGLGVHVAAAFCKDIRDKVDLIGGHYKCKHNKRKDPKTTPPVTTTPSPKPCPVPNPQSCCQIVVEGKTQLVPPALFNPEQPDQYPVTHKKTFDVAIEKVCPEKVIICGAVHKTIFYKTLEKDSSGTARIIEHCVKDDIPFQCFIDRDDANEGDEFEVVGAAFLCDVFAEPRNFGLHPDFQEYPVAWKFVEKEILKVCIRKVH